MQLCHCKAHRDSLSAGRRILCWFVGWLEVKLSLTSDRSCILSIYWPSQGQFSAEVSKMTDIQKTAHSRRSCAWMNEPNLLCNTLRDLQYKRVKQREEHWTFQWGSGEQLSALYCLFMPCSISLIVVWLYLSASMLGLMFSPKTNAMQWFKNNNRDVCVCVYVVVHTC